MSQTTSLEGLPQLDKEYEAEIDRYLLEVQQISEDIAARQQRIEQMQEETKALLDQIAQLRAA